MPGAADDSLGVLHLGVVLHLALLDLFFLHHPARNLWPQTTFRTAFPSGSWQHGGFGCPTEVHFFSPSPSKSAILMPFWTEPISIATCHKMMSKDSRFSRKMHGNFSTRRHSCIGYVSGCVFLWLWLQWRQHDACVCRCSGSLGKRIPLVSVSGKNCLFLSFRVNELWSADGEFSVTVFTVAAHFVGVYLVVGVSTTVPRRLHKI